MEERQFLHRLCTTALQVDVSIEFAGVIDSDGRLLVGKSRKMRHNPHFSRRKITCSPFRNSNHYGNPLFKDKTLSSNNIKSIVSLQSNLIDDDDAEFRLINLCDNVFLAYIPINELNDRFLYIYIRTEEYLEDVLLKLDTTFS